MVFFKKGSKQDSSRRELEKILGGLDVPVMPRAVLNVLQMLRDPESSMQAIAETIQWDPGLVTRILRTANSSAFGAARRIDDVRHAVTYMGRTRVEQLVLGLAVQGALPRRAAPGFQVARYWRTAAFRAALARELAGRLQPAKQAESFTLGLLQDMALPLLAAARPDEYGKVLEAWHGDPQVCLMQIETESFGWNHAQVGGLLARAWELPEEMVLPIERHHAPDAADAQLGPAVRLVACLRETGAEHGIEALVEEARSDYGLDPAWTRATIALCGEKAVELAEALT